MMYRELSMEEMEVIDGELMAGKLQAVHCLY